jgi:hypothetical protein
MDIHRHFVAMESPEATTGCPVALNGVARYSPPEKPTWRGMDISVYVPNRFAVWTRVGKVQDEDLLEGLWDITFGRPPVGPPQARPSSLNAISNIRSCRGFDESCASYCINNWVTDHSTKLTGMLVETWIGANAKKLQRKFLRMNMFYKIVGTYWDLP